jgi:tRNA(adenine34) deaminase
MNDEYWMQEALELARQAGQLGEVPVGALVVRDGEKLGAGFNQPLSSHDPTAHAEIMALRAAAASMQNYRLPGTTLYVTIEPCTMCLGAMIHARVGRLVFGAREPRAGVVCSHFRLPDSEIYNHRMTWEEGVLAEEAAVLMQDFFRQRR